MVTKCTGALLAFLVLLCTACAIPLRSPKGHVAAVPKSHLFTDAHWGILSRSLKDGRVIWAKNEKLHFSPASNLKLITSAVSLIRLGPDYRFTTTLLTQGETRAGILHGDLIIRASGDPSLSARFHKGGAVGLFRQWADSLVEQGIGGVKGDIVIDESLFDTQYMGSGWFWDDESLPYSAHISAFSINDNCVEVKVSAGNAWGKPGLVEVTPSTGYVTIVNETLATESDQSSLSVVRQAGSNIIVISGTVSGSDSPKEFVVTVHEPALYGAAVLKEVLEARGVAVHGKIRVVHEGKGSWHTAGRVLVSHRSPPLSAIINLVNKWSHNLSAELLLKTLGAVYHGKGTTRNGVLVVEEMLQKSGVVPEEIRIRDGSGLSRLSLVTPSQIVDLLEFMYHQPVFPYFYDSLPIAGVDGTLAMRMVGTPAEKNVRAKTGSSTQVSSLSGYVRKDDGEMIAFAVLTNNNPKPISEIRRLQDALCEWLSVPRE